MEAFDRSANEEPTAKSSPSGFDLILDEADALCSGQLHQTAIVVIDDSRSCLLEVRRLIETMNFLKCYMFEDPAKAMQALPHLGAGVVLVDYDMPVIDGISFIKWLRDSPKLADIPVIMMTASDDREVLGAAFAAGASDFIRKPIYALELRPRLLNTIKLQRSQSQLKQRALHLSDEVDKATTLIKNREREIIFRLARAAEYRDPETGVHIQRMAAYCVLIAEALNMPVADCADLELAAPLHDLGKIAIRDSILLKAGALTQEERREMQQHTFYGHRIVADSGTRVLQLAGDIALCHHEQWDGSGYPRGLAGFDIPLPARIAAVADVFDALTTARPYKRAWTIEASRDYLVERRGTQFDPKCVTALLRRWSDVLDIHARFMTPVRSSTESFELIASNQG